MTNNNKKYTINPLTKRRIVINGKVYKTIYTINPKTGRQILIKGRTYKRLQKQNTLIDTIINVHCEDYDPLTSNASVEVEHLENGDTNVNVYCNKETDQEAPQEAKPQIIEEEKYKKITTKSKPKEEVKPQSDADILRAKIVAFQKEIRDKINLNKEKAKTTKEYMQKHYIGQYKKSLLKVILFKVAVLYDYELDDNDEMVPVPIPRDPKKKYVYLNEVLHEQIYIFDVEFGRFNMNAINRYLLRKEEEEDNDYLHRINMRFTGISYCKIGRVYGLDENNKDIYKWLSENDPNYNFNREFEKWISTEIGAVIAFKPRELSRPVGVKKLTLPRLFKRNKLNQSIMTDVVINKYIKYKVNTKKENINILSDLFDIDANMCYYVESNYKANSCFINEIINTYHDQLEKKRPDGTRYYKHSLTYPYLCALLKIDNKHQDLGLTIEESKRFFNQYRLGLDLINHMNERVYNYRPQNKTLNKDISPSVLRLHIHNNHVIKVNNNVSKFSHIDVTKKADEIKALWINDRFNIRKETDEEENKKEDEKKYIYINNINDIMNYIKENPDISGYFILNISKCSLNNLLCSLVNEHKIIPHVKMEGHNLIGIYFDIDNNKYYISSNENTIIEGGAGTQEIDPKKYVKYIKSERHFYNSIIYEKIKSEYPKDVLEIEDNYKISPQAGFFTENYPDYNILNGIDMKNAYPSCLKDIEKVPIFGYFNRYRPYIKGEKIDPLKMYIVKNDLIQSRWINVILFHKEHERVYGYLLLEAKKYNINYEIIYVRDYERIENVEYKKAMDILFIDNIDKDNKDIDVYDDDNKKIFLHKDNKKFIANKICGLLEKKKNKRGLSYVFDNYAEAEMYKYRYMENELLAKITPITCEQEEDSPLYEKSELYKDNIPKKEKIIYILTLYKERNIVDGFRHIKEMIYCNMRLKMYKLALNCVNNNMNVCGIRTDSLYLNNDVNEIFNIPNINFNDEIGAYKVEIDKTCINKSLTTISNRKNYKVKLIQIEHINILDEYDTKEINEKINNNNRLIIKSIMPGSGKSQCIKNYHKDNHKVLFIVPNNELALDIKKEGYDAMTAHSFFGINHMEDKTHKKTVSVKDYDTICFEEIYQYKKSILKRVDQYIYNHQNIKCVATGDGAQNRAIEDNDSDDEDDDDANDDNDYIINMIFNKQINLKISKRLTNEHDRLKLNKLKDQIFNLDLDITKIAKEHFNIIYNINDISTSQNITHSNKTAHKVALKIHNKTTYDTKKYINIEGIKYYFNMSLVCRKAIRTQNVTLHTNYIYTLKGTRNKDIILFEPVEEVEQTITQEQFIKSMRLNYARTGYSIQGRSIADKFTICDIDNPYINRRWIWTAITRARDLKNITIYLMSDEQVDILHACRIELHFNLLLKKINKKKDKKISYDDVLEEMNNAPYCKKCNKEYYGNIKDGKVLTNVCINTDIKNNIKLCCKDCNK